MKTEPKASEAHRFRMGTVLAVIIAAIAIPVCEASAQSRRIPLSLKPDDVLPTGNEWIALPDIRASDGALASFNVISMHYRGLLQVNGEHGGPVLQPHARFD